MKRFLAFLLAAALLCTFIVNVSAEGVSRDASYSKTSKIALAGSVLRATSRIEDKDGIIKSVKIEQTIEKFAFLWFWNASFAGPWTHTYYKVQPNVEFVNNIINFDSGIYRTKSVFTVTFNDGRTETVTIYSNEYTVNK